MHYYKVPYQAIVNSELMAEPTFVLTSEKPLTKQQIEDRITSWRRKEYPTQQPLTVILTDEPRLITMEEYRLLLADDTELEHE